jgi:hypothetical protein
MPSFTAPKGWEMPTDSKPGEPFQAVGTFTMGEDGSLTMTEIDGTPIEGYEEETEEVEETPKEEMEPGETGIDSMMKRAAKMGALGKDM